MKKTKLIRYALGVAILAALGLFGCEQLDIYSVGSPSDLQSRIDSIAAAKAAMDTGDTTYIDIYTPIVGPEDNSAGWWKHFSDYFSIPANQQLNLEYVNHSSGANNYNNWNLVVANLEANTSDAAKKDELDYDANYAEYFALRSDAYGWGNDDYDGNMITNDYPDLDGDGDIWNDFRSIMQGAYIHLKVDHSIAGYAFVTATATGTNGTVITETYQQPVSASENIVAFLVCDGSYFEMKKAYLLPSEVTAIEDVEPVSLTVEGAPSFVELGNEDFWGDAIATVTFADGSSEQVDTTDLSFTVVPDMTTLGEKTVIVAYNKTKQGEYTQAVSTFYTLEVTNSVTIIEITSLPDITKYYFYNDTSGIIFDPSGMEVTATYSDGTTGVLANTTLDIGMIEPAEGTQDFVISYVGATSTVTTTVPLTLVKGLVQVGANDFSTVFWGELSSDYTVASNTSETITFYTYSDEIENWHCPISVLRNNDHSTEYAVTRLDNAGWGEYGYGTAVLSSNWNWDTFLSNLNGIKTVLTVTNNGDNTANMRYDVTYTNGETHYQLFEGITVDSSDLTFAITVENCYHVIVE